MTPSIDGNAMTIDEENLAPNTEIGVIVQFLRRNQFLVQLKTGQVVAFMPEKLLPLGRAFVETGGPYRVTVRLRKAPRMAIIVSEASPIMGS